MSSPLRFYGADEPVEMDDFVVPPNCAVEVTFRTFQERFLLKPDDETTEIILGCLGRAYARHPNLRLAVVSVLSNHGCFVANPDCPKTLSDFMRDFLSTAAKRLNDYHKREGTFWHRRYRAIPIVDNEKIDDRFAYVLTQGTKENLVWSARDWPGVSSVGALLGDQKLVGRWRDYATEYEKKRQRQRKLDRAAKRGIKRDIPEVEPIYIEYDIPLIPPPHWQHLSQKEQRKLVQEMLDHDTLETKKRHTRNRTRPLGRQGVLAVSPFERPKNPDKSPAPRCHSTTKEGRLAFYKLCRSVVDELESSKAAVERVWPDLHVTRGLTLPPLCDTQFRKSPNAPQTSRQ